MGLYVLLILVHVYTCFQDFGGFSVIPYFSFELWLCFDDGVVSLCCLL